MIAQQGSEQLKLSATQVQEKIDLLIPYLKHKLLPFWLDNSIDRDYGGFLSYFNHDGSRSGKTRKTLIMQLRLIYTMASAHRAGFGEGRCAKAAKQGIDFLIENFWDEKFEGWYWLCDRRGKTLDSSKVMYGQSFGVYAMAESALAFNNTRCWEYAVKTYRTIQHKASDPVAGGYWEMFERDWSLKPAGLFGGDRKTFDVHMHLMEAFTTLFELTQREEHRQKLQEVMQILVEKMLDSRFGTGLAQFDRYFRPLPAIIFHNVWGSDRPPGESEIARAIDNTTYGHNVEMAWLLKQALVVLNENPEPYYPVIKKLIDQALLWGVDREYGGLYVEGPPDGPATQTLKEFWQQAEALIGFLDALLIFEQREYWDAFENVFEFVWHKMINHEVGEWVALLERDGTVKWDYLGHEWKISYHTVRSVIQMLKKLNQIKERLSQD
jgi:mannobiose 2-epimerase